MEELPDAEVRRRFIAFHRGVARLVGGPGCGKSTLMRDRTKSLVAAGARAADITFLTFTRKAVASLQSDLAQLEKDPPVHTLHGFCLTELRRASGDLYVGMDVIDESAEQALFRPLASTALGMTPGALNKNLLAFQNIWYDDALEAPAKGKEFDTFLERLKRAFNVALRGELVVRYREYLHEGGDRPQIRHLVVDEYQDLNQCECEVMDLVAAGADSFVVAGDDDQAIYEFKGGRPDLFRAFLPDHPGAEDFVLSACMRYGAEIGRHLEQLMLNDAGPRIPKVMECRSPLATRPPRVIPAKSEKEQRERLVGVVQAWWDEAEASRILEGIDFRPRRAIVVLAWKGAASEIIATLREAKLIPDSAETLDIPPCDFLMARALCRAVLGDGPTEVRGIDLWAWVQCWPRVGPKSILKLMSDAADARKSGRVRLADLRGSETKAVKAAGDALNSFLDQPPHDALDLIERVRAADLPPTMKSSLLSLLVAACEGQPITLPIDEVESRLAAALGTLTDDPPPSEDTEAPALAIEIMTAHACKGLTADFVIVVDAFKEVMPGNKPLDRGRRLAYVAMSRARVELVLIYPRYVFTHPRQTAGTGGGLSSRARRPRPYLAEAGL